MRGRTRAGRRWWPLVAMGVTALVLAGCNDTPEGVDGDLIGGWGDLPEAESFVPEAQVCHTGPYRAETSVAQYDPVDCDRPHLVETVHVGAFTGEAGDREDPPGVDTWEHRAAFSQCEDKAAEFLGADFRYGTLWLGVALPTPEAWEGGARWFRCDLSALESIAGEPVTREGSLSGALADDGDLRLGCFQVEVDDDGLVVDRTPVPCDEEHDAEFAGAWRAPDGDYPDGDDSSQAGEVNDGCRSVVAGFTGVPDDGDVVHRVGVIVDWMSERDWQGGNRGFRCYLWLDEDVTESYEGIGPDALPVRTE